MKRGLFVTKRATAKELARVDELKSFADLDQWTSISKDHIKQLLKGTRIGAVKGDILSGFVKKTDGQSFYLFDYIYYVSAGHSHQKFHQTILIYTRSESIVEFRIYPKNIFHKFWDFITFSNAKKEKGQNLKSKYRIKSKKDPKILKSIFTERFKTLLLEDPSLYLESKSNHLIFFRNGQIIQASEMANQYSFFQSIIQTLN